MKPLPLLRGWTDFPIEVLGDTPGKPAPIRAAVALAYDGGLYLHVNVGGYTLTLKDGYFYQHPERGSARTFAREALRRLPKEDA